MEHSNYQIAQGCLFLFCVFASLPPHPPPVRTDSSLNQGVQVCAKAKARKSGDVRRIFHFNQPGTNLRHLHVHARPSTEKCSIPSSSHDCILCASCSDRWMFVDTLQH